MAGETFERFYIGVWMDSQSMASEDLRQLLDSNTYV